MKIYIAHAFRTFAIDFQPYLIIFECTVNGELSQSPAPVLNSRSYFFFFINFFKKNYFFFQLNFFFIIKKKVFFFNKKKTKQKLFTKIEKVKVELTVG